MPLVPLIFLFIEKTLTLPFLIQNTFLVTENDLELTWRTALMHQRRTVMGEGESGRTRLLEEIRVARPLTRLRTVVVSPTAKLVRAKRLAPALAPHHVPVSGWIPELQRCGTRWDEVGLAPHHGTNTAPLVWGHRHGDVEAVDEADGVGGLVVVAVVEAELSEGGGGGAAAAVAFNAAAAVTGGAGEVAVLGGAAGSGPDAAGPVLGGGEEGVVGEGVKDEAAAFEDGVAAVGLDGWPDGEGTVVDDR